MFQGNRLYFTAFAALMVALVSAAVIQEQNTEERVANVDELVAAQSRRADIALYLRLIVDAETGQRGFLLTEDVTYLEPYEASRQKSDGVLARITAAYDSSGEAVHDDAVRTSIRDLQQLHKAKMAELAASLSIRLSAGRDETLKLVRTHYGKRTMDSLRATAAELERAEERHISSVLQERRGLIFASRVMLASSTLLNAALLSLAAFLLNRDLRRRELFARQQEQHNRELEVLVDLRTQELSTLSSHLQSVAERERAEIARELHDELGGLMVAAKMDVAWLERHTRPDDQLKIRWNRLRKLLDDGVDMKRRVVETLRPTLLDNMGLVPAVRWVYSETCARAGLRCTEIYSDEDLRMNDEAAIAVFRVIQESLVNIVKHAKASDVFLSMNVEGDSLTIVIRDNGIGIPLSQKALRGHGLAGMRHRISSFGGTWQTRTPPGGGTEIEISLPMHRILPAPAADDAIANASIEGA